MIRRKSQVNKEFRADRAPREEDLPRTPAAANGRRKPGKETGLSCRAYWLVAAGVLALVAAGLVALGLAHGPTATGKEHAHGPTEPARKEAESTGLVAALPRPVQSTNLDAAAAAMQKAEDVVELASKAGEFFEGGQLREAIRLYEQALAMTPEDENLHYNLGLAYAKNGNVTNAEAEYREALRLMPEYPEVHNNLGNLLLQAGRLDEAEKHLTEAVRLMPENVSAQNNLGILRHKQQRTNDALACFERAVQYDTNFWVGHLNLARTLLALGERERAVAELRETLRINPNSRAAQRALAEAMGDAGKDIKGP